MARTWPADCHDAPESFHPASESVPLPGGEWGIDTIPIDDTFVVEPTVERAETVETVTPATTASDPAYDADDEDNEEHRPTNRDEI